MNLRAKVLPCFRKRVETLQNNVKMNISRGPVETDCPQIVCFYLSAYIFTSYYRCKWVGLLLRSRVVPHMTCTCAVRDRTVRNVAGFFLSHFISFVCEIKPSLTKALSGRCSTRQKPFTKQMSVWNVTLCSEVLSTQFKWLKDATCAHTS